MTPLEQIRTKVVQYCSPERQALLEPILLKMEEHKACPASTTLSKHGAFEGGLLAHTNVVMDLALGYAQTLFTVMADNAEAGGELNTEQIEGEGIVTAVLIHDIQKCESVDGKPYYIENLLKNGTRSEAKPWKINDQCQNAPRSIADTLSSSEESIWRLFLRHPSIQYPSGLDSLVLAEAWSPGIAESLTENEKQAIVWHGSVYERGDKTGFVNNESFLQIIVHAADMSGSRMGI